MALTDKNNKLPFTRWYPSDFLAGIRGLKAFEIGIYTVLINEMYERCAPLPESIDRLSWQCGCTKPIFIKTLNMLKSEGKIILKDGGLWNSRVEKEFIYRQNKKSVATTNANARWKKPNKNNGRSVPFDVVGNAIAMLNQKPEARSQKPELDKEKNIPNGISKKPERKTIAKRGKTLKSELGKNRELPSEYREYAQKWGHPNPELEWEMFVNFWEGNGETKIDWLATWRNRVLNSKKNGWYTARNYDSNSNRSSGGGGPSILDLTAEIIAERRGEEA